MKKKRSLNIGPFFYRFVMVVRKNVLEYIIALVVVKNKVRLKKCLKKFQILQSSIVQIKLSITSLRLIPKFRPVFDDQC
jgi:dynactin complex subunit